MSQNSYIKLSDAPLKSSVHVKFLLSDGLSRRRMMDLGIIPGAKVFVKRKSPLGDPRSYIVKGAEIALRKEEADKIVVQKL